MQTTTHKLSNSDYDLIARSIKDKTPDLDSTFEVACNLADKAIVIDIDVLYEVEHNNCIGGSYECDLEALNEIANEYFTIKGCNVCTSGGEPLSIKVDTRKIEKLLN